MQQAARSSRPPIIGQRIQLWDVASGRVKITLPYDQTEAFTFSPDGRWIACVNNASDILRKLGRGRRPCGKCRDRRGEMALGEEQRR